jgi:hypothetical protein
MIFTRTIARTLLAVFLASTGLVLAGCEDTKLMEMFDGKKKLAGDRKQVFPEGIPGVQQGVPPELMKGYRSPEQMSQTPADPNAVAEPPHVASSPPPRQASIASAPPAAEIEKGGIMVGARAAGQPEAPKPKRVAKPKPKPQPVAASAPQQQEPAQQDAAPPAQAATRPWPGSAPSGPPSDRFSR